MKAVLAFVLMAACVCAEDKDEDVDMYFRPLRACGRNLINTLHYVCQLPPSKLKYVREPTIVEQCCENQCHVATLRKYCNKYSAIPKEPIEWKW